jgi:lipoprotein
VRKATIVVVVVALLVGCFPASGGLTLEEHMAMRPAQVLSRFIKASQNDDERTGKQLSGDCWVGVSGWFSGSRVRDYRVPDKEAPPAHTLSHLMDFGYTSSHSQRKDWNARLVRDDTRSPWRVCSIADSHI